MKALILAAAAAFFQSGNPSPTEVDEHVVIKSVSAEPNVPSGVLATAIKVTGIADREARDYFIFFHRPGQPKPAVGTTCRIAFGRFDFQVLFEGQPNSAGGGRAVRSFRCGGGGAIDPNR
jgi:hypothetical protein